MDALHIHGRPIKLLQQRLLDAGLGTSTLFSVPLAACDPATRLCNTCLCGAYERHMRSNPSSIYSVVQIHKPSVLLPHANQVVRWGRGLRVKGINISHLRPILDEIMASGTRHGLIEKATG